MARTFSGTAQYLKQTVAVATATPFSMACWTNVSAFTNSPVVLSVSSATVPPAFAIQCGSGSTFLCEAWSATLDDESAGTAVCTINTLYHVAVVFASSTSRSIYLNGGGKVSTTTSVTPSAPGLTMIGAYGSATRPMAGQIAFPAFWGVALTDAEVLSLSKGISPKKIRPTSLLSYARLTGGASPEPDVRLSTTWALTGTPTVTANPRIYFP